MCFISISKESVHVCIVKCYKQMRERANEVRASQCAVGFECDLSVLSNQWNAIQLRRRGSEKVRKQNKLIYNYTIRMECVNLCDC